MERQRDEATERISPPAWGWPGCCKEHNNKTMDFPTRVGMARGPEMPM